VAATLFFGLTFTAQAGLWVASITAAPEDAYIIEVMFYSLDVLMLLAFIALYAGGVQRKTKIGQNWSLPSKTKSKLQSQSSQRKMSGAGSRKGSSVQLSERAAVTTSNEETDTKTETVAESMHEQPEDAAIEVVADSDESRKKSLY
jgi:hypothetical protein